jgi:6-phosphogluconolactonase
MTAAGPSATPVPQRPGVLWRVVDDVADQFAELVVAAFGERVGPRFALVLSGGPTARACYERLAGHPPAIDWGLVDVYMGDERWVPAEDPDANQRLVREALLDRVGPVGSFTPMPTDGDPTGCAARYQAVMADLLAGPGIDLIHLGMGPDGHSASLFAGSDALDAPGDQLVAVAVDPNGRNPHPRLTVTLGVINRARLVVFTVAGPTKREAVAALQAGADLPAARVEADRAVWLVDPDAAGTRPAG